VGMNPRKGTVTKVPQLQRRKAVVSQVGMNPRKGTVTDLHSGLRILRFS